MAPRFAGARFRVSSVNGRIMLSGTAPDAVTLDKAVTIAQQFGADVINTVQVLQPQQVMLEVRFVEASRRPAASSACSGTCFSKSTLANIGRGAGATAGGRRRSRRRRRQRRGARARRRCRAAPFGFLWPHDPRRLRSTC